MSTLASAVVQSEAQIIERPILFSAPMVQAILAGRKTQTRRILKQGTDIGGHQAWGIYPARESGWIAWFGVPAKDGAAFSKKAYDHGFPCPHGATGTHLWVRETFAPENYTEFPDQVPADGRPVHRIDNGDYETIHVARYRATEVADLACSHEKCEGGPCQKPWRPSIFMPRWASRITLEITDVRVERLNEITEKDALAEGVADLECGVKSINSERASGVILDPRMKFMALWDSINGKRPGCSWAESLWVWAIQFKRIL